MPEALASALAAPGLLWLALAYTVAGVVRGFTGFGTALIVMPLAGAFLPMADAIVVLMVTGIGSWPVILPRAWKIAQRREVGVMALAAVLCAPLGIALLVWLDALTVRWVVSLAAAATLLALVTGWRYRGQVSRGGLLGVGSASGVLGGLTGLTGPPVILFYLAGQGAAAQVRANVILFLSCLDIGIVVNLLMRGMVGLDAIWLGVVLALPYMATITLGQWLFRPSLEKGYRWAAYGVIFLAILSGLPIFG